MIAALYVETGGCYFGLDGVDPWDEARDARKYEGPWPVVAHPPCQRWGRFWHGSTRKPHQFKLGADGGCFEAALASLRKWGGVLEHPADSKAWAAFGLNRPPRSGGWARADEHGGWTCYVEQGFYGHSSRKPTWLLVYGMAQADLPDLIWGKGEQRIPEWMIERYGYEKARRIGVVAMVGGKDKTKIRNATPKPFRDLLLAIASYARNVETYVKKVSTEHDKSVKTSTTSKETSNVTIKIEITGADAQEVATQLIIFGSLITQKVGKRTEEAQTGEPEILEPKKSAPKRTAAKKSETIEHEPTAGPDPEPPTDQEELTETEADLPVEEAEAEKPMSIDELRQYTISKYLAEVFPKREDQKDAFGKLLAHFKIEKLGDLPEDQAVAFKAEVDKRIAAAGKK